MSLSLSEYTKVDVSWDIGGTHSAPPSPLAGFKGLLRRRTRMEGRSSGLKGRTSEGEEGQRGRRRKMRDQERENGEKPLDCWGKAANALETYA